MTPFGSVPNQILTKLFSVWHYEKESGAILICWMIELYTNLPN